MALSEDTEALMLAYVYGELSANDARDFERRMNASTPEAAELRAEVESLKASRDLFGRDAAFGIKSGVDLPPAHLVDAIMNAEKLARPAAIRDAALARVAPPADKTFTAKLSRWLLGGGLAVGAAAALFIVVTQDALEPKMEAPASEMAAATDSARAPEPSPVVTASPPAAAAEEPVDAKPAEADGKLAEGGEFAGLATAANANTVPSTTTSATGESAQLERNFNELAKEEDAPRADDATVRANKAERQPDVADAERARSARDARDARIAQDPASASTLDEKKRASKDILLDEAKTKAKESAPAREATKAALKDAAGDSFGFDAAPEKPKTAPAQKPAPAKADKKAEEKSEKREMESESTVDRLSGKAGMRSSIGADKGASAGPAPGALGGAGIATGAASGSVSGGGRASTSTPTPTPSTPVAASPPPPPPPPAPAAAPMKAPADEADDDVIDAPKKVISREELQEQRKNLKKKSAASTPQMKLDAERAKRLEQANIALASGQRELAAKRWLGALDQMALAETLDPERALGATPLVGQMRALVELKRPVDAAKVARRLGRWDVRAFDVVPGLLLGAQVAEQVGDERLARELWTRLLDVPSEKAKARAALDRMEGAKALRRMQYDSDAAEAPAAAAESAKE